MTLLKIRDIADVNKVGISVSDLPRLEWALNRVAVSLRDIEKEKTQRRRRCRAATSTRQALLEESGRQKAPGALSSESTGGQSNSDLASL